MYDTEEIVLPDSAEDWMENDFAGKPGIIRDRLLAGSPYPLAFKDKKRLQRVLASYYALITAIDSEIGRVLDKLEESGELENTIVFYTAVPGAFRATAWSNRWISFPPSVPCAMFLCPKAGTGLT